MTADVDLDWRAVDRETDAAERAQRAEARLKVAVEALEGIARHARSEPWPDHFADAPPDWALDDYDSASSCGYCGAWLTVVRPGKSQCDCCSDGQDLGARAAQALAKLKEGGA